MWRFALAIVALLIGALALMGALAPDQGGRMAANPELFAPEVVADLRRGGRLFAKNCATCHGTDLYGTGNGPPLIHPYYRPDHHADVAFRMAMLRGVKQHHWQFGDMPPVPGLSPDEVEQVLLYIRTQQHAAGLLDRPHPAAGH